MDYFKDAANRAAKELAPGARIRTAPRQRKAQSIWTGPRGAHPHLLGR